MGFDAVKPYPRRDRPELPGGCHWEEGCPWKPCEYCEGRGHYTDDHKVAADEFNSGWFGPCSRCNATGIDFYVLREKTETFVIAAGNVVDGFNYHGPFDTKQDAETYKKDRGVFWGTIIELQSLNYYPRKADSGAP